MAYHEEGLEKQATLKKIHEQNLQEKSRSKRGARRGKPVTCEKMDMGMKGEGQTSDSNADGLGSSSVYHTCTKTKGIYGIGR